MSDMQRKRVHEEFLQDAAVGYLRRHEAKHLDSQTLFDNAVELLKRSYSATQIQAENAVARAHGFLSSEAERRYLDISSSDGHTAVVVNPDNGVHYAVPVAEICKHLIDSPARRRLCPVENSLEG